MHSCAPYTVRGERGPDVVEPAQPRELDVVGPRARRAHRRDEALAARGREHLVVGGVDHPERHVAQALERLRDVPFWMIHSADDEVFAPACSERFVAAMRAASARPDDVKLSRLRGLDHVGTALAAHSIGRTRVHSRRPSAGSRAHNVFSEEIGFTG